MSELVIPTDLNQVALRSLSDEEYLQLQELIDTPTILPAEGLLPGLSQVEMTLALRRIVEEKIPGAFQLGIEAEDTLVGEVSLMPATNHPELAFIGYQVAGEHRRKGYATAAVKAVVNFATSERDIEVVQAEIKDSNTASQGVAIRAGFIPFARMNSSLYFAYMAQMDQC